MQPRAAYRWMSLFLGDRSRTGSPRASSRSPLRPRRILLESLEARLAPVVGFDQLASEVLRGGSLDGVVFIETDKGSFGTGSLLSTGRHILTAAHVVDSISSSLTVTFHLNRGQSEIDIPFQVPASAITLAPGWQVGGAANQGNDLALITLLDPTSTDAGQQVVAPYGAEGFTFFTGEVLGQVANLVGYGRTGTGATGNQVDEIQRIQLPSTDESTTFTLGFQGETTGPLAANATREQVQSALAGLSTIGKDANGLPNVEVSDRNTPAGSWDIRFVRDLGGRNVELLTGKASTGESLKVTEWFAGGSEDRERIKREGANQIDEADGQFLRFDFDSGKQANNRMGDTGLGSGLEAFPERGDSGSPLLIDNQGRLEIAGIFSFFSTGGTQDANNFPTPDGSFGSVGTFIATQSFLSTMLSPNLQSRHLSLDMAHQVLGRDGLVEDLRVAIRREESDLVILVSGSADARFNGEYFRGEASLISGLTLRGSDDNETFVMDGDLQGLPVEVIGGGGKDRLQDADTRPVDRTWTLSGSNQGHQSDLHLTFREVESLHGGTANDQFLFLPAGRMTEEIDGGSGLNTLDYSRYDRAVVVHLGTATAPGIGGTFSGIQAIMGSSQADTLVGPDRDANWTITSGNRGILDGLIAFDSIENLNGGSGSDHFQMGTAASLNGSILGGDGHDHLDYSTYHDPVTFNLETLKATGISGKFGGLEQVTGSRASDNLIGRNRVNQWAITGVDAGRIDGMIEFLAIERVVGGSVRDVFTLSEQGSISGRINGAAGNDWLDARSLSSGVHVNLARGTASRTGGVVNLENVFGSRDGYSTLVGNDLNNILVGYFTGNEIDGGLGRDLIIAGSNSAARGGQDQDIVIAGSTIYDNDVVALRSLLTEWTRGTDYETRVRNLRTGGGATLGNYLEIGNTVFVSMINKADLSNNETTVPLARRISGDLGRDFFAVRFASVIRDLNRGQERFI